jgi:hypothetical protein
LRLDLGLLADPAEVIGVDTSEGFLGSARAGVVDARAVFVSGDAQSLPMPDGCVDAVVSGLAPRIRPIVIAGQVSHASKRTTGAAPRR